MDGHVSNKGSARRAAADGRFSTSLQRASASTDQIELCRAIARLIGYDELVVAMPETGTSESTCTHNNMAATIAQTLTDLYVGGVPGRADGPAMRFSVGA